MGVGGAGGVFSALAQLSNPLSSLGPLCPTVVALTPLSAGSQQATDGRTDPAEYSPKLNNPSLYFPQRTGSPAPRSLLPCL